MKKRKNSNYKISFDIAEKKGISKRTVIIIAAALTLAIILGVIIYAISTAFVSEDFTVYDIAGRRVNLSDFKGKPIIVNFWATWCKYCVLEMPTFEDMYGRYGDDISFLMVNATFDGETREKAIEFYADGGYSFPIYFDSDSDATSTYAVDAYPITFFFDARGKLLKTHTGMITEEELDEEIRKMLE